MFTAIGVIKSILIVFFIANHMNRGKIYLIFIYMVEPCYCLIGNRRRKENGCFEFNISRADHRIEK